jgi:hypothetical protein
MPNLNLLIHPFFIHMCSRVIIWDFRPVVVPGGRDYAAASMRIADLWNRYALSIIMDRSTHKLTAGRSTHKLTADRIPSIPELDLVQFYTIPRTIKVHGHFFKLNDEVCIYTLIDFPAGS